MDIESLKTRAAEGDAEATYLLGGRHFESHLSDYNPDETFRLMNRAVELGSDAALNGLGFCYLYGVGTERDLEKAVSLFQDAAKKGVAKAFFHLGTCYDHGIFFEANPDQAACYFDKAANSGDIEAATLVAGYYLRKADPHSRKKAIEILEEGVEQECPTAMLLFGYCLVFGIGIRKNTQKALQLFQKVADTDADASSEALRILGEMYLEGKGVRKDVKKAFEYFLKGSENGNIHCRYSLVTCYLHGTGTKRNDNKAMELLQNVEQSANSDSGLEYLLGWCYDNGRGVTKDREKAAQLYRRSAEKGIPNAQYALGYCLKNGKGTTKNREEAKNWLIKAAEQDYPWTYEVEKNWRFAVFVVCCCFFLWIVAPLMGIRQLIDTITKITNGDEITSILDTSFSIIFMLVGPILFWYGIFFSSTSARWGSVLYFFGGCELFRAMLMDLIQHGEMFTSSGLLFIFFCALLATLRLCRFTLQRTYWLELKYNKRETSAVIPVLVCLAVYAVATYLRFFN